MKSLLEAIGRQFAQLFVAALIVYGAGVLAAPDLKHTYLIAVAAIIAAFAAGLAVIPAYEPRISFTRLLGHPLGDWLDAYTLAFVASLIVTLPGVLGTPDFATMKAVIVAAIVGAFNAGVRAVVGVLTPGERPNPAGGVPPARASAG